MNKYPHLFSPIKIGNTTVKNRIFMPPLSTNLGNKGYVTDELVAHYGARAKGGVGLFVTEVVTVEPTYVYLPGDMSIHDDSFIPGWKKLVDAVHEYDAKILPQLFHPAYMAFPIPGTPQLIAPSNVGPYYAKEAPRPVTKEELKTIIRQFGEAAGRVKQAGGDGVEIHAAHAHGLLGGFLSPQYNKRTDEYGGDINGRLRLTLEVIEEVRKVCGEDFIIDVRISGDEYSDGGLNINDMIYVSKKLEAMQKALVKLQKAEAKGSAMTDAKEQAFFYKDTVMVIMAELRKPADELEMIVDKELWPIPTYGELMFEV